MPPSATRCPYNHGGVFWCLLVDKIKLSAGRKQAEMPLISEIPLGETVYWWLCLYREVFLWYSGLCSVIWHNRVHFDTEKRSCEILMMYTFVYGVCIQLVLQCEQVLEHFAFLSKRCSLFKSQQPCWQGTSKSSGWFVVMTHNLDIIASDTSHSSLNVTEKYCDAMLSAWMRSTYSNYIYKI